jgi:hypothetical protein
MYDEFAAPKSRFKWTRVVFALAAVFTFTLTAFPLSPYSLGLFAGTLALALVLRFLYVKLNRRRPQLSVVSGWVFVIALGIAVLGAPGRHSANPDAAGSTTAGNRSAERQGLVSSADDATRSQRCLGIALDEWESMPRVRSAWPKPQYRELAGRVCKQADSEGVLRNDGLILDEDLRPIMAAIYADMQAEARGASN